MKQLDTIQKANRLNDVFALDKLGPGGAHHKYGVYRVDGPISDEVEPMQAITFQKGPRKDPGSITGILDTDLLEIVRDRLTAFQAGPFSCRENAIALTHIEDALLWLNKRVEDRAARGVLGTNEK